MIAIDPNPAGIGDVVVAAWIAEGAKAVGQRVVFSPSGYDLLLRMLGQEIKTTPYAVPIASHKDSLFIHELSIRGKRPTRVECWSKQLGISSAPVRPRVQVPEDAQQWAMEQKATVGGGPKPLAIIFPGCNFSSRRWSLHKYLRTGAELRASGWAVLAMDGHFKVAKNFPWFVAEASWEQMAAMMTLADCVIGNDSGPCHLAGTIGTKSFAVMGPTDPEVIFGHCPEVETLRVSAEECPCVGCHFEGEKGYTDACSLGCEALSLLPWRRVAERVDRWHRLGEPARTMKA